MTGKKWPFFSQNHAVPWLRLDCCGSLLCRGQKKHPKSTTSLQKRGAGQLWGQKDRRKQLHHHVLFVDPDCDDRSVCTTEKGQEIDFLVPKGTTSMPLMLISRKTRDGEQRSLQKKTRSERRQHDRRAVFFSELLLRIDFLNLLPNIFLPNF
jgi:hypothetical protein